MSRLDGIQKQCNLLCPSGSHPESKGAESPFFLFLFIYLLTLVGNLLIIVTVAVSETLNLPM